MLIKSKINIITTIEDRWTSHASRCDALRKIDHLCAIPEMHSLNLTIKDKSEKSQMKKISKKCSSKMSLS